MADGRRELMKVEGKEQELGARSELLFTHLLQKSGSRLNSHNSLLPSAFYLLPSFVYSLSQNGF
jgi:hypothetical protein